MSARAAHRPGTTDFWKTNKSRVIPKSNGKEKALVSAPQGRDAALAVALLHEAGIAATACADIDALAGALGADATLVVVSEEAMRSANLAALKLWIDGQPP